MPEAVATEKSFAAVIVAAGSGTRFGRSKHDLLLAGKPLWRWSADVFEEAGASEVVVVGDVPGGVPGGVRRRDSVRAGIESLILGSPIVLIHDAARPFAGLDTIEAVVTALVESEAQGAVPAIPVTDTIKRCEDGRVVETVDRSDLVAVQTPQGFRTEALIEAHRSFPVDNAPDDAALVEAIGGTVVVVKGDRANMKITFPFDLALAEAIVAGGRR